MSIRYKFFCAFSVVIALACGLAFYGMRGISTSGDLVVRLYDGPLMGINHARSAHAALNAARLLMQAGLSDGAPKEIGRETRKTVTGIADDLKVVRDRVKTKDVTAALERTEASLRDWSETGLKIVKPQAGGRHGASDVFHGDQEGRRRHCGGGRSGGNGRGLWLRLPHGSRGNGCGRPHHDARAWRSGPR